jgi:hypothetical protein
MDSFVRLEFALSLQEAGSSGEVEQVGAPFNLVEEAGNSRRTGLNRTRRILRPFSSGIQLLLQRRLGSATIPHMHRYSSRHLNARLIVFIDRVIERFSEFDDPDRTN